MIINTEVSICIVNYNSWKYLKNCLDTIHEHTKNVIYEIIVVDNCSSDGSVELIKNNYPKVKLVENKSNIGFARATNQAVFAAQGEFVLLLNPDTELKNDAITICVKSLREFQFKDAVSCKVINPDGSFGVSRKGRDFFNISSQLILQLHLNRFFCKSTFFKNVLINEDNLMGSEELYFVACCFFLIRRDYFLDVGLLDERFFLYSEDDDLCIRIRQNKGKIRYCPDGILMHWEKGSSIPLSLVPHHHFLCSRYELYLKHKGIFKASLYRSIVCLSSVMKFIKNQFASRTDENILWERKKTLYNILWSIGIK